MPQLERRKDSLPTENDKTRLLAFVLDEAYLPAILTAPPMTDKEFAELCAEHPDLFFEMSAEGELIVMPPPYSLTGIRQGKIFAQLNKWAEEDGRGIAAEARRPLSFFPTWQDAHRTRRGCLKTAFGNSIPND